MERLSGHSSTIGLKETGRGRYRAFVKRRRTVLKPLRGGSIVEPGRHNRFTSR